MRLHNVVRRKAVGTMDVMLLALIAFVPAGAQTVPVDREALESGAGAGMAAYADPNGYPGPMHVLELQDTLRLSDEQVKDVGSIFDEMSENARALGLRIIMFEEQLHDLFKQGKAEYDDVRQRSAEIGKLRGDLRAVHLTAHLQTTRVLTQEQIDLYTRLRKGTQASQHHRGAQ